MDIDDYILSLADKEGTSNATAHSDDEDGNDEYGPDLYKDEEDRKRLLALPEVERERILSERSEERQRNLERLEVRKLLNDGRRDDTTRRSARSKGTGTSHALSELTRRREEKHKSRSARRRHSPSPEGRKRRQSSHGGKRDSSADEYAESDEEAEKETKRRIPTLEEVQSICLTRDMIQRWLYAPFFPKVANGCFVRLFIGNDPKKKVAVYRLCQVIDLVSWHKTYKISDSVWANQALKVKHGKAERAFPMEIVSNGLVTEQEYTRFVATCETENTWIPNTEHVENKKQDIQEAQNYVLNDQEVNEMIAKKRQVNPALASTARERVDLLARLDHAKSIEDAKLVKELTDKLNELDAMSASFEDENSQKQKMWAELNRRNREKDRMELQKIELEAQLARQKAMMEQARLHQEALKAKENLSEDEGRSEERAAKRQRLSKTNNQSEYENLVCQVASQMMIELLE